MSPPATPIDEADLHAYVDDALEEDRLRAVEQWLAAHPADAARVAAWRRQARLLAAAYGPIAEEPVPDMLCPHAMSRRLAHRHRARLGWPGMAVAAMLLLALGAGGGWFAHGLLGGGGFGAGQPVWHEALSAHRVFTAENRHAVEVGSDQREHLVRWLSNRLGFAVKVPDLAPHGFQMIGGRLLADDGEPAAQFMYEDAQGQRLTLYISRASGGADAGFATTERQGMSAFYWYDGRVSYALVGTVSREALNAIAVDVYRQLEGVLPS